MLSWADTALAHITLRRTRGMQLCINTVLPTCCDAGPPPGANMGMGMMPQHDVGMGFDMSAGTRLSTSMFP